MTTKVKKIPTFICPDYTPPPRPPSPENKSIAPSSSASNYSTNTHKRSYGRNKKDKDDDDDIHSLYQSIKEFNANELKGKERIKLKADKLTELGAPPLKKQKVPLKTKFKQIREQNIKQIKLKETLLNTGLIHANQYLIKKKSSTSSSLEKKRGKFTGKLTKHADKTSSQPSIGSRLKNGVLHIKK